MMNSSISGWGKKPTASTATTELKEAVKLGKTKQFTFNITEDLHQQFKVYAIQKKKSMAEILNEYIGTIVNT